MNSSLLAVEKENTSVEISQSKDESMMTFSENEKGERVVSDFSGGPNESREDKKLQRN